MNPHTQAVIPRPYFWRPAILSLKHNHALAVVVAVAANAGKKI